MIGSPQIDKYIRKTISPILRNNGFSKVKTRNNWAYQEKCIWIFNIRSVGYYFSQVTGFPPMSLTAWLGIFYTFIPHPPKIKVDKDGLLLPPEYAGHLRLTLKNHNCKLQIRSRLKNPLEVQREDIWWIDPDGCNLEPMINDLAKSLQTEGIPWLKYGTDLNNAFDFIQKERDCYNKFRLAMYLSKEIGNEKEYIKYTHLWEEEEKRINMPHKNSFKSKEIRDKK